MPVEFATEVQEFVCPRCDTKQAAPGGSTRCVKCSWRGEVHLFRPLHLLVHEGDAALPEDAQCVNHPRKRAVDVCAGTGDFICDLCRVEVNGQTYSATYVDRGGQVDLAKAFDRKLDRPDRAAALTLVLMVFPIWWAFAGILAVVMMMYALHKTRQAYRLRREDPVYARLVSRGALHLLYVLAILLMFPPVVAFAMFFLNVFS